MFQTYFDNIYTALLADTENTELSLRTYFQALLETFVSEKTTRDLIIKHEPCPRKGLGRPDFKVTTSYLMTIGLIETKKYGENLESILSSEQMERYKQYSDNIILTDYRQFLLIKNGEVVLQTWLFSNFDLQKKRHKIEKTRSDELSKFLKLFFESEPETISRTHDLAVKLSDKARLLKEHCIDELEKEGNEESIFFDLYEGFKKSLLPMLDKRYFSDIYAQTVTYSLFLAALNCSEPKKELNRNTAYSLLPTSFALIKELFHRLDDFPAGIIWAIDEIISILKATDFTAINLEFTDYRNKEQVFRDPFIYFYEDFLTHYDKTQRELRGVYYTPEPVVSFIVSSIEEILKNEFGIKDGYINKDVTLLDFASGTGTFLLHAFKLAIEQARKIGDNYYINKVINEQTINNFYGFELLVAPYVVAHLKISEFLKGQGISIDEGKRLNIFLTNTLTNKEPEPFPLMPNVTKEGREASRIKNQEILVILGNPPYSVSSQNKSGFIADGKMERYKGGIDSEKNIQPLSDDYIKFIRFAHWKMESVERGIVGMITNNSFIDGLIHRGMRQELMKDFDEIYILNLHGNSRIGERSPDGSKDENVFDIMQGVCISLFVKKPRKKEWSGKRYVTLKKEECKVYYQNLYGLRAVKFAYLLRYNRRNVDWLELKPEKEYNFFVEKKFIDYPKKNSFSINQIFNKSGSGIKTNRDHLFISFKKEIITKRISDMINNKINDYEFNIKYNLSNNSYWNTGRERKKVRMERNYKDNIIFYNYRPFDKRFLYYQPNLIEIKRGGANKDITNNFLFDNLGLCFTRQLVCKTWQHVFITDNMIDMSYVSIKTRECSNVAPLYVFNNNGNENNNNGNDYLFKEDGKRDNFKPDFRKFIKKQYKNDYSPEQILGYIYAVLHSPTYRTKYLEFLKIDFPRIPFTDDEDIFRELSAIGLDLIEHHLLKVNYGDEFICKLAGEGSNFKVESVKYERIPLTPFDKGGIEESGIPLTPFDKGGIEESGNSLIPFDKGGIEESGIPLTPFDKGGKEGGEIHLSPPFSKSEMGKVWFNKERYFALVPEEIWNFYIGGYQVLDKWLKERKKHKGELSPDDVNHFLSIINSIAYTIETMGKIDEITRDIFV